MAAVWNPVIRDTLATFTDRERSGAEVEALIRERAAAGLPFLVAEAGGRVLGFAACAEFRAGPGYRHTFEHTILLDAAETGRGLGAALIAALAAAAAERGAHSLIGAISGENPRALAFHLREGFVEVGRIPEAGRKFGRWLDLVLAQRLLEPAPGGGAQARARPTSLQTAGTTSAASASFSASPIRKG